MNKPITVELDNLDLMLVKELELNARQNNSALARKLATSETTVKRRLQRLLDEEVITIATVTDRLSLGFPIEVGIGFSISHGKTDQVIEHLRSYKKIQRIILTTGRYDIYVHMAFRDTQEVTSYFLDGDISRIPYPVRAEKIFYLDTVKSSWTYLNDSTNSYHQPKHRDLDELDLELIKEMELCPTESVTNLAKKLGVRRVLTGRRLKALLDDNVIRVVSVANPSFFGLNIQVLICVKVELNKVRSVTNSLVAERRVRHIFITAGPFEILLSAAFQDLEEMSDFLRNHLSKYPGVVSYETIIQIGFAKRSYSLLTLA